MNNGEIKLIKKMPVGVIPRWLWEEQQRTRRHGDLLAGIARYIKADADIPLVWFTELKELMEERQFVKAQLELERRTRSIGRQGSHQ